MTNVLQSKITAIEVTHTLHPGVYDGMANCQLAEVLKECTSEFVLIEHPFEESRNQQSLVTEYRLGKQEERLGGWKAPGNEVVVYIKDLAYTIYRVLASKRRFTMFFGVDALNTLAGLILRRLGLVQIVFFYSVDYSPTRFAFPLLNTLYHWLEINVAKKSDYVWCCSDQIAAVRIKEGSSREECFVVAPGLVRREWSTTRRPARDPSRLVYVGRLSPEKGVGQVLEAVSLILNEIPSIKLLILGDGPQRTELERIVETKGLVENVEFLGFVVDFRSVINTIRTADIGIACYDPSAKYNPYAFPGKVFQYLACGLPVIMTDIKPYSRIVERANAGKIVQYTPAEIARAILLLRNSPELLQVYAANASKLAATYDFRTGATTALGKALQRLSK